MVTPEGSLQYKLPEFYSIFRCETYAVSQAVKFIDKSEDSLFVILTDSMSTIEAIKDASKFDHVIQEFQETLFNIKTRGKEIILIWMEGNEKADSLAKSACSLPP